MKILPILGATMMAPSSVMGAVSTQADDAGTQPVDVHVTDQITKGNSFDNVFPSEVFLGMTDKGVKVVNLPLNFTDYRLTITGIDTDGFPVANGELAPGDKVILTMLPIQGLTSLRDGTNSKTREYIVPDMRNTIFPSWPKTITEMRDLIKNDQSVDCNFSDVTDYTKYPNPNLIHYQATAKNQAVNIINPMFKDIYYYNDFESLLTWDSKLVKVVNENEEYKTKSSFGVYTYGDVAAKVDSNHIGMPLPNAGTTLTHAYIELPLIESGAHHYDHVEVKATEIEAKVYDEAGNLISTNKIPDIDRTLVHHSANVFSGILSTLDPFSALTHAVTGLGGLVAGSIAGVGTSWAEAMSGYDQNGWVATHVAPFVNLLGDVAQVAIPIVGEVKEIEMLNSISKIAKFSTYTQTLSAGAEFVADLTENQFNAIKFLQTSLGMTNIKIMKMIKAFGGSTSGSILEGLLNLPIITTAGVDAIQKQQPDDLVQKLKNSKAVVDINLGNIKLEPGQSVEISLDFDWRLGAAFSGGLFHIWSNSDAKITEQPEKMIFYITGEKTNGFTFVKQKDN